MPPEIPERRPGRRSNMPLVGGILLVGLLVGGYFAWSSYSSAPKEEPAPQPQQEQTVVETNPTYASSTMKVTLTYPREFTLQEPYAYTRVSAAKPISGVKFVVPTALTQGTNLAPDSGISIEQLPRANACTGDIYLKANVKAQSFTEGTRNFSVATSSETAGNDTFEELVFAVPGSAPCIAVRYFLHSTKIDAAASSTTAFDRATVLAAFDSIRQSLIVQ